MLDHYLHTAYAAALLLHPDPRADHPRRRPGRAPLPEQLADASQALAWFEAEHPRCWPSPQPPPKRDSTGTPGSSPGP